MKIEVIVIKEYTSAVKLVRFEEDELKGNMGLLLDSCDMVPTIVNYMLEAGVPVLRTLYLSKYNKYVVYEYEPSCRDGFNCCLFVDTSAARWGYAEVLIDRYAKQVWKLNRCLTQCK